VEDSNHWSNLKLSLPLRATDILNSLTNEEQILHGKYGNPAERGHE
jgi:hypothetical protein